MVVLSWVMLAALLIIPQTKSANTGRVAGQQGSRAAGQPKWWVYGAVLAACPDIVMDDHDGGETRRARTG
jgi:hypothetical protein